MVLPTATGTRDNKNVYSFVAVNLVLRQLCEDIYRCHEGKFWRIGRALKIAQRCLFATPTLRRQCLQGYSIKRDDYYRAARSRESAELKTSKEGNHLSADTVSARDPDSYEPA